MDENIINDFKQFISATVSQATSDIRGDLAEVKDDVAGLKSGMAAVQQRLDKMDQRFDRMDQRFDDLELKLDTVADAHSEELADHDQRLGKLENQAA